MKKTFDIVSGAITLLVPILVEKICSPFLEKIVQYISAWNTCIANWLYQRIAEGERVNLDFYIILFLVILLVLWQIFKGHKSFACSGSCEDGRWIFCGIEQLFKQVRAPENKKRFLFTVCIAVIPFLTLTNYINHNEIRLKNDIEIVAPYISDIDYKILKSEFYGMQNYNDFMKINEDLDKFAREYGLSLQ